MADTAVVALDWHLKPGKPRSRRHTQDDDADAEGGKAWPQPPAKAHEPEKNAAAAADAAADPGPAPEPAAAPAADPCAFSATIDAFDPARWEARARCLDALGKPDDARAARAKAKALRASDHPTEPGQP
jgi:hypothetical protein